MTQKTETLLEKSRKSHIKNLVALANIDGDFHKSEMEFLYQMGKLYGVEESFIHDIIDDMHNIEPHIPEGYSQKLSQLLDLTQMMLADDIIENTEMKFCQSIALTFGFYGEIINAIIKQVKQGKTDEDNWRQFKIEAEAYRIDM